MSKENVCVLPVLPMIQTMEDVPVQVAALPGAHKQSNTTVTLIPKAGLFGSLLVQFWHSQSLWSFVVFVVANWVKKQKNLEKHEYNFAYKN
jgi:uncharacterized membrane protein